MRITEETYIVHEKLDQQSYSVKTDPHTLCEKAKTAREAGVSLEFYAHIPQLETRDENALVRKFELGGEDKKDKPVPQKFMTEVFALDGLYLLTNIKTLGGNLKIAREIHGGSPGATELREIDENWDIYLDPETADLLGLNRKDNKPQIETSPDTPSAEILKEIHLTRVRVGLTTTDIRDRNETRRKKAKIR